jgi:outer membrane protein assembly factor BamB
MNQPAPILALGRALLAPAASAGGPLDPLAQWPQWRGPLATGVAPRGNPPLHWSEERNVRWKAALPGLGHSSPIVWGDRVFVTSAVAFGEAVAPSVERDPDAHHNVAAARRMKFVVLALDRRDGSIVWERVVRSERPHEGAHETGSWASASPVTDGRRLFAHFGSRGLYALDLDGKLLWQVDLGDMQIFHGHGEGSSPALHGDTLVVNWDHQGDSFVVALDARDGAERWRVARDEITSWSTPLVVEHQGRAQVVTSATGRVRSYDLKSGELIWECGGLSRNVVATPVAGAGLVFVGNSYDWQALLGIRLSAARGDVTGTGAVVWTRDRDTPYVPSPLLYGNELCFLKHNQAFLTCVEASSGATRFGPQRLTGPGDVFASPVGAAERIYVVGRNGATAVVRHGEAFELLAVNRLQDSFSASPAIAGNELFLRGERHLYCLR